MATVFLRLLAHDDKQSALAQAVDRLRRRAQPRCPRCRSGVVQPGARVAICVLGE